MSGGCDEIDTDLNHAKKRIKRMIFKLSNGRKIATHLQTLLKNPTEYEQKNGSFGELALQIYRSFTETLDEIQSVVSADEDERDGSDSVDCGGDGCSGETKKVKDRRGCYKRRKTSDSFTVTSHTTEDCYGWRKYGQKKIKDSKYHRCYYRCTHKSEGCKALKQVQKVKENPLTYQITYLHHHICKKNISIISPLVIDSEADDLKLISFQSNNHSNNNSLKISAPPSNQESKQLLDPSDDAKSMADIPWDEIIGSDDQRDSCCFDDYSSGSTSLDWSWLGG